MTAYTNTPSRHALRLAWPVCAALAFLAAPALGQSDDVAVTDYGTVTLTVKDTDLAQVLEMLSIQSKRNIITSKNVSATVSANLYDVTFDEALKAILHVNGYDYTEEGNFIYVYTREELDQIAEQQRRTASRTYSLDYLSGADANEFIQPLLSDAGQSSFRGESAPGFKADIGGGGEDSYAFTPRLVVNDYEENLESIGKLLNEVDTPPMQVLIEATILQTALDEQNAWGVDFSIIGDMNFTDLTNPLNPINDLLSGSDSGSDVEATASSGFQPGDNKASGIQSTVGNTPGAGGFKMGIIHDDFSIFLKLLDEVRDTTVLARPKVMCLNRQKAEVLVGARVGYLSTTATETTTTQSVEFLDTGIQLLFRPFISENGMVRLELAPSVSEASLRTVTDANGLVVTIPDENTNELTTNVRIPDGQTLILGGLFRESTTNSRRQVPFLGDIPILGAAFKGHDDTVDRDEIIFLITPTIVEDGANADAAADALEYAEAVRVGTREALLPFSQTRLTDNENRKAVNAFHEGDLEKALYHINNSLRLKPIQPEMIRFREQVSGAKEQIHERGLLERALRRELGALTPMNSEGEAAFSSIVEPPQGRFAYQRELRKRVARKKAARAVEQAAKEAEAAKAAEPMVYAPTADEQQSIYDELFNSYFENLDAPASDGPSVEVAGVDENASN